MASQVDIDTEEDRGYEKRMELYLEGFDILDDDEALVFIGVPDIPGDSISEP